MGLDIVDTSFDYRLRILYEAAMRKGLWNGTYAASNRSEYWAEGTHAWIDPKGGSSFKRIYGGNTRAALKAYDPDLATLLTEIYGDGEWKYTPVATRTHLQHLQGFDPQDTPTFRWPEDVEEPYAQLRDPDIDSGDEWVNLNPYNPNQLLHLNPSISTETRTHILLVNLADFDVLVYQVHPNGTERLLQRIPAQRGLRHAEIFNSHIGDVYLIKDPQERSLALFQAEAQTGRALIGDRRPRNTETDKSRVVEIPDPQFRERTPQSIEDPVKCPSHPTSDAATDDLECISSRGKKTNRTRICHRINSVETLGESNPRCHTPQRIDAITGTTSPRESDSGHHTP